MSHLTDECDRITDTIDAVLREQATNPLIRYPSRRPTRVEESDDDPSQPQLR